jgi:serine/threonine-protein kinase SRPK3
MTTESAPFLPGELPKSGFEVLDGMCLLEEETFSWYDPEVFYPVRIGEIFQSKYEVLG